MRARIGRVPALRSQGDGPPGRGEGPRPMGGRDRAAIAALVAALVLIASAIALPSLVPSGPGPEDSGPSPSVAPVRAYREGVLGRWSSITPLTARTAADQELVALIFSGLVRLGPDGELLPDLASSWTTTPDGARYTFTLRPDAAWQDGRPVTAADVAFTFRTLQDPGYGGPQATSWREVTVTVIDPLTVRFDLATPLGGFLQALTQPLLPAHLLADVAPADLGESPFSRAPVGSGPFRLVHLDGLGADLVPAALVPGGGADAGSAGAAGSAAAAGSAGAAGAAGAGSLGSPPVDSLASPTPSPRPARPLPYLEAIRLEFFDDVAGLSAAYRAGRLDAAVGLPPASAAALAGQPGSRLLRYPTTTLTAVVPNQRGKGVFREARLRRALLALVDRDALVASVLGGLGRRADGLIPPESWAFDPKASRPVAYDRAAAGSLLRAAGWRKLAAGWAAPKASKPFVLSIIAPDQGSNPTTYAAAGRVAKAWSSFGFKVELAGLKPADLARRLQAGSFSLAVVDINIGLDPDLYPLLASSQSTSSGSNISGVQSLVLDEKLTAARKPGSTAARRKAYSALQAFLADTQVILPLYFRDAPVVASDALSGPTVRPLGEAGDRFWDVLTWRLADGG